MIKEKKSNLSVKYYPVVIEFLLALLKSTLMINLAVVMMCLVN